MNSSINKRLIAIMFLVTGIFFSSFSFGQGLPESEHRDKVIMACSACHGLDRILDASNPMSAEDWEFYVYDMVSRGAPVPQEDMADIIKYLADNFSTK